MGNRLFQEAREFVQNVLHSESHTNNQETNALHSENNVNSSNTNHLHSENTNSEETVEIAKNALSSAFANSTEAEKVQLRELQEQLENHLK